MKAMPPQKNTTRGIAWWLYLLIAVGGYVFFKYYFADLASSGDESLVEAGELAAPIFAIVFLLLAANALYRDKPHDGQKGDQKDESRKE